MQNRTISIVLLLCLTAPLLGVVAWLQLQKKAVRKEVKHKLMVKVDRGQLVLLAFSKEDAANNLKWEHSKEFEYHNEMYDVVQTETKGDTLYYWCWWDDAETALNKQLTALTTLALQQDPAHQNGQKQVMQFLQQLFFEDIPSIAFVPSEKAAPKYVSDSCLFLSWNSTPPSPPPDLG